ncbi:MAG TPA: thioredoxin domain-containing protein [Solirubrobacteraceae bacterium]|nr:thioredoxin domain-containing protein [Solirubrobacteraceae bacterium]
MANALADETSPYLRQHAENPVDWLAWGEPALARAVAEDKPLLVSIGYSSCHWCHVMERESFEDERTAALMNAAFVCVKVDREERPDVDAIYMEAVQSMTGQGGWPLNVFLTPEQLPFYGGTYFPPQARQGLPSWTQVLEAIVEAWRDRRDEVRAGGEQLRERLVGGALLAPSSEPIGEHELDAAVAKLRESFDVREGGFGGAPKFPQASVLEFLLLRGEREMSGATLHAMAGGGIHDQLGGGFARYSVDPAWTVPHFEKMLYDNALLARAYLHGFQRLGERRLLDVCLDTLAWALREMRGPEGGFYSALDADSEGVEGRFYVWTLAQLRDALAWTLREMRGPEGGFYSALDADSEGVEGRYYVWTLSQLRATLGEDADAAIDWFGASEQGNFSDPHHPEPGLNVLQDRSWQEPELAPDAPARERIRARLLAARSERVRPALDDKRLTSWNALMICALAEPGALLRDEPLDGVEPELGEQLLAAASECAAFVLEQMRDERGRLLRSYNDGRAKIDAYLEDYAFMLEATLALFEATCEERWFDESIALADALIARFADSQRGGFFSTAADAAPLIARRKDVDDAPIPSGGASAAVGLLRLAQLTGSEEYERHAVSVLRLLHEIAPRHPSAFGHLLQAIHWYLSPARPIACAIPARA